MAVSRKSTEALALEVKVELNRPDEDDLLAFPEAYFRALSKAHRFLRRKVVDIAPDLLANSGPYLVTTADSGATYDLEDTFLGPIGVWEPPGPPTGARLLPVLPEQGRIGFWVEEGPGGSPTLHLTRTRIYSPGLYISGVKVTAPDMDETNNHELPEYCEDALVMRACFELAQTPGIALDDEFYRRRFNDEWTGDKSDPSDVGILGILRNRSDYDGIETAVAEAGAPWWRGIGGS